MEIKARFWKSLSSKTKKALMGKKKNSIFKFKNKSMTHTTTAKRFLLIRSICGLCKLENESLLCFSYWMFLGDTLSEARQLFYLLTILLGFSLAQSSGCPFKNQGEREVCRRIRATPAIRSIISTTTVEDWCHPIVVCKQKSRGVCKTWASSGL